MMNKYGFQLSDYVNDVSECTGLLARYLNNGSLGLFLGAGASMGLGLPNWRNLVINSALTCFPGDDFSAINDNNDLKKLSDKIKKHLGSTDAYIKTIKKQLYEGVSFNFHMAKKELLISLTALIIGKSRGNINNILTLNFDSVLEWYLRTNGLSVNITTRDQLLRKTGDVDIIHIHGYLPYAEDYGVLSDNIIMSKREFEDWIRQPSFERDLMEDFYRRQVFLAVGLSAQSLIDDVGIHLRALDNWYFTQKVVRNQPYGVAFLTDCTNDQEQELVEHGIIPCVIAVKEDIPNAIFEIAKSAMP